MCVELREIECQSQINALNRFAVYGWRQLKNKHCSHHTHTCLNNSNHIYSIIQRWAIFNVNVYRCVKHKQRKLINKFCYKKLYYNILLGHRGGTRQLLKPPSSCVKCRCQWSVKLGIRTGDTPQRAQLTTCRSRWSCWRRGIIPCQQLYKTLAIKSATDIFLHRLIIPRFTNTHDYFYHLQPANFITCLIEK